MDKKQLKKEYRKYSRQHKTTVFKLKIVTGILIIVGAGILLPTSYLALMNKIDLYTHFSIVIPGFIITVAGVIIDIIAMCLETKEFKEYVLNHNE